MFNYSMGLVEPSYLSIVIGLKFGGQVTLCNLCEYGLIPPTRW
jgi:hypothetical protein